MKRVICISGDAASGKSTAARHVLQLLPGWTLLSTGQMFRDYCVSEGLDPQGIFQLPETLHRAFDDRVAAAMAQTPQLVVESRLAGYLGRDLPDALRVFCDCPLEIRAARAAQREPGATVAEHRRRLQERDGGDTNRFLALYGVDYHDPALYHLTVDTARLDPARVATEIVRAARDSS